MIYYYFSFDQQIWLMATYDKGEMSDLSAAEKRALREAIDSEVRVRKSRKGTRERGK